MKATKKKIKLFMPHNLVRVRLKMQVQSKKNLKRIRHISLSMNHLMNGLNGQSKNEKKMLRTESLNI